MKDYRKIFKKHYGVSFGSEYEIHHIDLNHDNNEISNLMILPKRLHHQYHFLLNSINYQESIFNKTFNAKIHSNSINGDNYNLAMIESFIPVLQECNKWYDYKMYLNGEIPNIHGINLEVE